MFETKTFNQLWNELIGEFSNVLPPEQAQNIVKKAYLDVLDSRDWNFLLSQGYMIAPAMIATGSATFTRLSNLVVVNAALQTAINLLDLNLITQMAIRVGDSTSLTTQIYQIWGWDSATLTLTLDRPFLGINQTITPQIFRQFYLPPYIVDPANGYITSSDFRCFKIVKPLTTSNRKRLIIAKRAQELDQRDPERTITGEPTHIYPTSALPADYPGASSSGPLYPGTPRFELWPFWTGNTEKIYQCLYQRRGDQFINDRGTNKSVLPFPLEPELILLKAKMEAALWADRVKGSYKQLQATNWMQHATMLATLYTDCFARVRQLDNDLIDNSFSEWETGDGWDDSRLTDLDPQYAQTHATYWETWGSLGGY